MKRMACAVGICVLAFGVAILAQQKSGSAEQELIKIEDDWAVAQVNRNLAFFEKVLADDYILWDPDGAPQTKADLLALLKSGELVVVSAVNKDAKARIYGDAAVVTGRWTAKEILKGKESGGQFRYTDTFIKRAGRWQCVAGHSSRIAAQ